MIRINKYEELGKGKLPWLDAKYHFSFAEYHSQERMGFGPLRVINDDTVKAGSGFDMHPHRDMEIITYVRKGAISHKDNLGNSGKTKAGDVQVMSAGTGIFHSEYNLESEDTKLYQIWIKPNRHSVAPRWETNKFLNREGINLLVSGRPDESGDDVMFIHQDASIYGVNLNKGKDIKYTLEKGRGVYILVSKGNAAINDEKVEKGDGVEVFNEENIKLSSSSKSEFLIIDVPLA